VPIVRGVRGVGGLDGIEGHRRGDVALFSRILVLGCLFLALAAGGFALKVGFRWLYMRG
jgi:hypothetical protein